MQADEYRRRAEQEGVLWWFDLLQLKLFASLDSIGFSGQKRKGAAFGRVTGGLVGRLRNRFPTWSVVGLDKSDAALAFARRTYRPCFVLGGVQRPPFKSVFFS
jgi:hypothetical protein